MSGSYSESVQKKVGQDSIFARLLSRVRQEEIVIFVTLVLLAIFCIVVDRFATVGNLLTLMRSISALGILAIGMALVVIARGLDLSQVASMSLGVAWAIKLMNNGTPMSTALILGLAFIVLVGLVNGFLVAFVEIPPLFATLATGIFLFGFGRVVMLPAELQHHIPETGKAWIFLGSGTFLGIPMPIIIFPIVAIIGAFFLKRAVRGKFLYAHGDNLETARITGIGVRPQTILEYILCAVFGYIGGLLMSGIAGSMDLIIFNSTLIFDVILVVVLGGISLTGGRGSIWSVIAGTALIGTILNAMILMNIQNDVQSIVKGLALLAAILLDNRLHPRDEETARQGDT
jgi:ribose transport system permease protein